MGIQSPLAPLERHLRGILPADLYAEVWLDPSTENLGRVFDHLRTLQHILYNYVPRQLVENLPTPGQLTAEWREGTLMFTDLAGFTPLMEANASYGRQGAARLLDVLNQYFSTMLEILSKSGGYLLEFTGDALLVQFEAGTGQTNDTQRAIRAGLRMQHAMQAFQQIETPQGILSLGMRIGIHRGRYLTADIGTPHRMEHILMGTAVQTTKRAEGAGQVGYVCLTNTAHKLVKDDFDFIPTKENHYLVVDEYDDDDLGTYEIVVRGRRLSSAVLLDRSQDGILNGIDNLLDTIEPLASYIPDPILNLLVESTAKRHIEPQFASPTVMFVSIEGIPQAADNANPDELNTLVTDFSRLFALINGAVESRGGVLKAVTYHLYGSDMMIVFGIPNAHTNDPIRAAHAALVIRQIIADCPTLYAAGQPIQVGYQIGIAQGGVFAAEIGDLRGRREFNVLGDTVNTAARLMGKANRTDILITETVYEALNNQFICQNLGKLPLKGKSSQMDIYQLTNWQTDF